MHRSSSISGWPVALWARLADAALLLLRAARTTTPLLAVLLTLTPALSATPALDTAFCRRHNLPHKYERPSKNTCEITEITEKTAAAAAAAAAQ